VCAVRYEVVNGVARFVSSEHYVGSFGYQWNTFARAQLDSANGTSRSRDTFEEKTGWRVESMRGLRVLDAGCGMGRFAELCAEAGAEVHAVDLSTAVEAAARNLRGRGSLSFYQADIMNLPFAAGTFDFISAEQVIHHTPDARQAFANLAERLAPGGVFAAYLYRVKAPLRELADDWIRERATVMEPEQAMDLGRDLAELGRELQRVGGTVTLERGVPLLGIEPGEHDVQRLIYWTMLKCFWNDDFSPNLNALVNYDWYAPLHASRHTPEEVERWCADAGLEIDRLDVSGAAISVLARRPG
jgi:SAM-dependent methyltransferase